MDQHGIDFTRDHYNKHVKHQDSKEALRARKEGPSLPLKELHNDVKRQLIYRFAGDADSLLDLACGRGGDIWKWADAQIKYIKGIDLSPNEVQEARRRFQEMKVKRRNMNRGADIQADFEDTPMLGQKQWREELQYDAITCMFAIHYFFESEKAIKTFLHNVSINLREGGYFFGCVPDGKAIMSTLQPSFPSYKGQLLQILAEWKGSPRPFGSAYSMAIGDTVTQGHGVSLGSYEYLVYEKVFVAVAAEFGLQPVTDYVSDAEGFQKRYHEHRPLQDLLEQDTGPLFRHFRPRFPFTTDSSLTKASKLNCTFVFQKVAAPPTRLPTPVPGKIGHIVAAEENGDTVEAGPAKRMKVAAE